MNRHAKIVIIAFLIFAIVGGVLLNLGDSRTQLARYKSDLRAKGERLTWAELTQPLSTSAAEVASRESFQTNPMPPVEFWVPTLMAFSGKGVARVAWKDKLVWDSGVKGTAGGDWNAYDRTNVVIAPYVAAFRESLQNPPPETGYLYRDDWQSSTNVPRSFIRQRRVAQAFAYSEINELHHGDLSGAVQDLHALAGMARMYRRDLTLVHQAIRISVALLGLPATWEALQAPGWTDAQLSLIQSDWEQADLFEALVVGMQGERASGAVVFKEVRRLKGSQFWQLFGLYKSATGNPSVDYLHRFWRNVALAPVYKITSMDQDESLRFHFDTKALDLVKMLKTNCPAGIVIKLLSEHTDGMEKRITSSKLHRYYISEISTPNMSSLVRNAVHAETLRRLAVCDIAIKRYELRNHHPPADLQALVPEFLSKVPIDPMSAGPICYRLDPDATYALYSVGEDAQDDGGRGGADMWAGPDVVWPSADFSNESKTAAK